jgi:hypothetical protein
LAGRGNDKGEGKIAPAVTFTPNNGAASARQPRKPKLRKKLWSGGD